MVHDQASVKFLFHLLLLASLSALAGAAWVAHRVPTLPDLPQARTDGRQRDLVDDLKQASIKGAGVLEVSEADLNRQLARVLSSRMAPPLEGRVRLESVRVRLEAGRARVFLVWEVMGWRSSAAVDLAVRRLEHVFRVEVLSGAYGRLEVPRGLMRPLTPVLRSLAAALNPEIQALFQMNQITLAQGRLRLDPRFP
jgi:hypothetical protein